MLFSILLSSIMEHQKFYYLFKSFYLFFIQFYFFALFYFFIYFIIIIFHFLHLLNLINVLNQKFLKAIVINLNHANVLGFVRCCYVSALVLTCFRRTKGRATYFRPETIVESFLHLMVLFF